MSQGGYNPREVTRRGFGGHTHPSHSHHTHRYAPPPRNRSEISFGDARQMARGAVTVFRTGGASGWQQIIDGGFHAALGGGRNARVVAAAATLALQGGALPYIGAPPPLRAYWQGVAPPGYAPYAAMPQSQIYAAPPVGTHDIADFIAGSRPHDTAAGLRHDALSRELLSARRNPPNLPGPQELVHHARQSGIRIGDQGQMIGPNGRDLGIPPNAPNPLQTSTGMVQQQQLAQSRGGWGHQPQVISPQFQAAALPPLPTVQVAPHVVPPTVAPTVRPQHYDHNYNMGGSG